MKAIPPSRRMFRSRHVARGTSAQFMSLAALPPSRTGANIRWLTSDQGSGLEIEDRAPETQYPSRSAIFFQCWGPGN